MSLYLSYSKALTYATGLKHAKHTMHDACWHSVGNGPGSAFEVHCYYCHVGVARCSRRYERVLKMDFDVVIARRAYRRPIVVE